ncbi:hypothetical protein AB9F46_35980, partial [Rhizobium leguminosarum]
TSHCQRLRRCRDQRVHSNPVTLVTPTISHARNVELRRLVLIGRLDEAERALEKLDPTPLPPASRAAHEVVVPGVAIRRL